MNVPRVSICLQNPNNFPYLAERIATSDDTMAEDCLEKMVKALDENPDCYLVHCPMRVIDQHGAPGRDW